MKTSGLQIALFVLPGHAASQEATDLLKENLGNDAFRIQVCPTRMGTMYRIPFLTLEDNSPISGIEGIKYYVSHLDEFRPVTV